MPVKDAFENISVSFNSIQWLQIFFVVERYFIVEGKFVNIFVSCLPCLCCSIFFFNHNYITILESDWSSAALI